MEIYLVDITIRFPNSYPLDGDLSGWYWLNNQGQAPNSPYYYYYYFLNNWLIDWLIDWLIEWLTGYWLTDWSLILTTLQVTNW